jgi:hypothetical protein
VSAVERLEAAIAKLEAMRDERQYTEQNGWLVEPNPDDRPSFDEPPEPFMPITNDELIVVLHRTIDAQLAILRAALIEHTDFMTEIEKPYWTAALALADAILGSES